MQRIQHSKMFQFTFACGITCLNLYALVLADPFNENISHIANVNQHLAFVFLWATSFSLYLLLYTPYVMHICRYTSKFGIFLFYLACLLMIGSILIPYHPDVSPQLADLHIQISSLATLLFTFVFLHVLYIGYYYEPIYIQRILPYYICIVGSCAFLYLLMGCVSTILEVIFVISMSWYLLLIKVRKKTTSFHN